MKKYIIRNCGEADNVVMMDLTEEQFEFLCQVFEKLNNATYTGDYAPILSIWVPDKEDINFYGFNNK